MIKNNYNVELERLNQIKSVDIPHLKRVQMIIKDRVDAHSYDPIIFNHLKQLPDDPDLPDDLTKLRDGNNHEIIRNPYPNIVVKDEFTYELGRKVRYLKIFKKGISTDKALIYMHGGAFYGGTPEDTLPFLTFLATKFAGAIYSVDYGIAPEKPYPNGIMDSLSVVAKARKDFKSISLSGDSAGGAIALSVSQLCHNLGLCQIDKHLLFYPTVVHGSDHQGCLWNDHEIPIKEDQRQVLHNNYTQFKQLDSIMTKYYVNGQQVDLEAPIISSLYAQPLIFKKVLVLTGEFDPFRLQDEAFVQKISIAGCDAKYVRYGGLGHAFLNYIGKVPAVEDSLNISAQYLNNDK